MARTPEPDVRITEGVSPAAQVYDTYVRPATPAPSPLHEVANALAPLSAELFSLASEQQQQQNVKDKAAGEAAFWNDNADGAAHGVATGQIPADRSPKFMEGYAGMAGLNDAANLVQTIGPDYQKLDKTNPDPAAFDKWFFPYVRGKANPALMNNPAYAKAWGQRVAALHANMGSQFVTDRSNALKAGAFDSFSGSLGNTIDDQYYGSGGAPDTIKLAQTLQEIRTAGYKAGLEKDKVDKAVVDVVATKALEEKNPGLLDVLNNMAANPDDPTGVKMGQTEYGVAKRNETGHTIQTRLLADQEREQRADDRRDKLEGNSALSSVLDAWSRDINYQPTDGQLAAITKIKPEFLSTMKSLRENILANNTLEDPTQVKTLYEDIFKSGDPQGVIDRGIRTGVIKTAKSIDEITKYGNLVENYNKSGGAFKITEDPSFKSIEQAIITHTKDPKWAGSMFAEQGLTDAGRAAIFDARMQAMQWQMANPSASPIERAKFLYELQEGLMKRIQPGIDLGSATQEFKPTYQPAPGAPSVTAKGGAGPAPAAPANPQQAPAQPTPGNNAPATAPAAPGGTPAGQQGGLIDTPQKAAAAIGKLPAAPRFEDLQGLGVAPSVIQGIQATAKQMGMAPQDFINKVYEKSKALGQRGAIEPQAGGTQTADAGSGQAPMSFSLPGGGKVDIHGVSPEVAGQVQQMVERMARLGGSPGQPSPEAPPAQQHAAAAEGIANMRGELSARYESAKAGSGAVAYDRTGGWSYGRYQFASGGSVADGSAVRNFLGVLKQKAPELEAKLEQAGGAQAAREGDAGFKAAWKQASADPRFREAEDEAAYAHLVGPAIKETQRETGLDVNQRSHAVQEVMWSTAIQHGGTGAAHLWRNALRGHDPSTMSDADLIKALYAERSKVGIYFKSSTPQVQRSVKNRFADEERHALAMLSQGGNTRVASAD